LTFLEELRYQRFEIVCGEFPTIPTIPQPTEKKQAEAINPLACRPFRYTCYKQITPPN
jgi:hypothetical protein